MYSIFFSRINISFPLIENRLKEIINPLDKVVIIPWTFPKETNSIGLDNYFSGKKLEKYKYPLKKLGIRNKNITICFCSI